MTQSSRVLIVLILSPFLIWSMGGRSEASDGREKESVSEKPTPSGASQPSVSSDGQPTSPKPAPETKPQLPVAPAPKSDASTEHKEGAPEKSGTGSSPAPAGSDSQSTTPKPAAEAKPHPPATPSPTPKGEASTEHKEGAPEKPGADSQPTTTPKPAPEAKPNPPAVPAPKSDASAEHKEGASKKSTTDSQPTIPKPTPEAKPQPSAVPAPKSDASTEHKETVPGKSVPRPAQAPAASDSQLKPSPEAKPQPSTSPVMKADLPPDREIKDKEPALKKTLGSLILSVKLALLGDLKLFHYEIDVEDDEQTITLIGRVSTEEEKTTAKEVAQKVQGVKNVVNKLTVEKDLAKTLSKKQDDTLTALVKERFSKSATLKAANFEVKTEEGIVLLNGTVRFQVIALEAAETARQVPGVRAVNTEKVRLEGES